MSGLSLKLVEKYDAGLDRKVIALLASDGELEVVIQVAADEDGTVDPVTAAAMFRNFADYITHRFPDKVAA